MGEIEFQTQLLNAKNYRDFISRYLEKPAKNGRQLTYAALARKAGFASRAFPRDVVLGKRRINSGNLAAFVRALKLTGDWRRLFTLLVALEEPKVLSEMQSKDEIIKQIQKVKSRLNEPAKKSQFPHIKKWMEIYAALGRIGAGASVEEISQRTCYSLSQCEKLLAEMLELQIISASENGRYQAGNMHVVLKGLGRDEFFQTTFLDSLNEAAIQARKNISRPDHLFLNSVFSVDKSRLPEFCNELRELMVAFADKSENPEGDCIAKLVLGFYSTSNN